MDGLLLVNKPRGVTSHDVVDFVRKNFGIKKAGHTGTLDPAATGILIILVGSATKLSSSLMGKEKEYEATIILGKKTDSADATGKVISEGDYNQLTEDCVRDVFDSFVGMVEQVPPMVSALKHNGIRLYKLARKGKEIPRNPRLVHIKKIEITRIAIPEVDFRVECSKGTYIRQLCEDIGDKLGCGGHLAALRRTKIGEYRLDKAVSIDALKSFSTKELSGYLITKTHKPFISNDGGRNKI